MVHPGSVVNKNSLPNCKHPGPPSNAPNIAIPTQASAIDLHVRQDRNLLDEIAKQLQDAGATSASLRMTNAAIRTMDYVIPAPSPDTAHAAWYSDTYTLTAGSRITDAAFTFGQRDGAPFFHCHGTWQSNEGEPVTGHMIPEACILAEDIRISGYAFHQARFDTEMDEETNFSLFTPRQLSPCENGNAVLVRLRPNRSLDQSLSEICQNMAWPEAEIRGLGSIIGAQFEDGRRMESYATEFLVTSGTASPAGCTINIDIGGMRPGTMSGRLAAHRNAVFVTCEFALINKSGTDRAAN